VDARVEIRVFNVLGQLVAEIGQKEFEAGYHHVVWDGKANNGTAVGSGLYFCQLVATPGNLHNALRVSNSSRFTAVRKMLLLK
jgi:flagellar hook assembly protein FlgD